MVCKGMDAPGLATGAYLGGVRALLQAIADGVLVLLIAAGQGRGFALQASGVRLRQVVSWRHTPSK